MIASTGSQAACDQPSSTRHPLIPQHLEIGAQVVKVQQIATVEETQSPPEPRSAPSTPATRIARTLHRIGLTIIVISIIDNINEFVADSRNLPKSHWLSSFGWVAPYSLWAGVLLVFAGIVVRDRSWSRKRPNSNYRVT
jgi:hypothetical protein